MRAYYNEIDPFAARWLRELIKEGCIAAGDVDCRSIEDVIPSDLKPYTQCHFFAGIGVWSYALRQAGWPDDRPVWTGSCPCQPFSSAGKGGGFDDERHLWPAFHWLIAQCSPVTVFGEQVASKDGLAWLDLVSADMEGAGYTIGAVDTCAAGFGAPHIRQRMYWVAHAAGARHVGSLGWAEGEARDEARLRLLGAERGTCRMADPEGQRGYGAVRSDQREGLPQTLGRGATCGVADAPSIGQRGGGKDGCGEQPVLLGAGAEPGIPGSLPRPTDGFWRDADWLLCRDGKWRPTQSEIFPLAHGATNRVGILRGAGNAIVAPQAIEIIKAYLEGDVCGSEGM